MALTIAVIAAMAALVSAFSAFLSWWYTRVLSRAAIGLVNFEVDEHIFKHLDQRVITFHFENVGKEALHVTSIHAGFITFEAKQFENISTKPMIGDLHSGSKFGYMVVIPVLKPTVTSQTQGTTPPEDLSKTAVFVKIRYKGRSFLSRKEAVAQFIHIYDEATRRLQHPMSDELQQIEQFIPQNF